MLLFHINSDKCYVKNMVLFHSSVHWMIVVSLFCTITGMIWASSNFLKINNVNISFFTELQINF